MAVCPADTELALQLLLLPVRCGACIRYALNRYLTAIQSRGAAFPIHHNGGAVTWGWDGHTHADPDARPWGGGYWFQNTRLMCVWGGVRCRRFIVGCECGRGAFGGGARAGGWVRGLVDGCVGGWMGAWVGGWVRGWVRGCVDGIQAAHIASPVANDVI